MFEKFNGLIVVLENDKRQDDCEKIINAIKQIKGVQDVKGNVVNIDSMISETRVRNELITKIWDALKG